MRTYRLLFLLLPCLGWASGAALAQDEEYGQASFYSDDFQGRPTAYGDVYDKDRLTCAHKVHPYGTMLRVTRIDNGRSVVVKVIDKGPFIKGRVVDLSRRAAENLGIVANGATEVKLEVVSRPGRESEASVAATPVRSNETPTPAAAYDNTPAATAAAPAPAAAAAPAPPPAASRTQPAAEPARPASQPAATRTAEARATQPDRSRLVGKDYTPNGIYKFALERPGAGNFAVQVALFNSYDNVMRQVADLQALWFENILVSIEPVNNTENRYRVMLGPFPTQEAAQAYDTSLRRRYRINGFVVNMTELNRP